MHHRTRKALGMIAAGMILAACTSAEADNEADPVAETETDAAAENETVEVVGVDYGFEGLPETMAAGTTLSFRNDSDVEFHEMVVMRLADDETRSLEELLALPDEEAMAAMTFVGVAVAAPEESGTVVDGDLTLTEPGRYVATCFIPQGADPEVVAQAMNGASEDAPPDLGDGAPHAMAGMVAEFTVE